MMSGSGHPIPYDDEPFSKRFKFLLSASNQVKTSSIEKDRISDLPEDVIVHIISLLPTRDRIHTGALAKRWQYLWTHVPHLYFNFYHDMLYLKSERDDWVKLVNRTLILRSGSEVNSFGVDFRFNVEYSSDVDVWVQFAVTNKVEKFELDFSCSGDCYTLPQHLYRNSSFRELEFYNCNFALATSRGTVTWSSLTKLSIAGSEVSDELVEKILAGAPALEILDLYVVIGIRKLRFGNSGLKKLILELNLNVHPTSPEVEISAPNIQSLELNGEGWDFKLRDMTSLVEAAILVQTEHPAEEATIYSLSRVHTLKLNTSFIEGIALLQAKGVHPLLSKCKRLTIDVDTTTTIIKPSAIAWLLQNAPGIETLTVSYDIESDEVYLQYSPSKHGYIDQYWTSQKGASNYLRNLRIVKFNGFWAYRKFAFSFVQFVLKNTRVLQKMIIKLGRESGRKRNVETELLEISQNILSFERSSPNAKILVFR